MRTQLWPTSTLQEHSLELDNLLKSSSFLGIVALNEDKYVGFAEASIRPFANGCDSRPVIFLEGIWVDSEYRNTGVGKGLLEQVEHWARSQNINEIGSDTEIQNQVSYACHLKWGFEETERVIYFRKKLF